jgi:hypothetical protein
MNAFVSLARRKDLPGHACEYRQLWRQGDRDHCGNCCPIDLPTEAAVDLLLRRATREAPPELLERQCLPQG